MNRTQRLAVVNIIIQSVILGFGCSTGVYSLASAGAAVAAIIYMFKDVLPEETRPSEREKE